MYEIDCFDQVKKKFSFKRNFRVGCLSYDFSEYGSFQFAEVNVKFSQLSARDAYSDLLIANFGMVMT